MDKLFIIFYIIILYELKVYCLSIQRDTFSPNVKSTFLIIKRSISLYMCLSIIDLIFWPYKNNPSISSSHTLYIEKNHGLTWEQKISFLLSLY